MVWEDTRLHRDTILLLRDLRIPRKGDTTRIHLRIRDTNHPWDITISHNTLSRLTDMMREETDHGEGMTGRETIAVEEEDRTIGLMVGRGIVDGAAAAAVVGTEGEGVCPEVETNVV